MSKITKKTMTIISLDETENANLQKILRYFLANTQDKDKLENAVALANELLFADQQLADD